MPTLASEIRSQLPALFVGSIGVAVACAALAGSGTAAPAAQRDPANAIRNLRVCDNNAFDFLLNRCSRDERQTPLTSRSFTCSADVSATARSQLNLQWTYNGAELPRLTATARKGRSRQVLSLDTGADPFPLPGGRYRCTFTLGHARASGRFTSAGPTGDAVDVAVCAGTDTANYDGFLVCQTDGSSTVINKPDSLVCNVVYPQATGKISTIDILQDGQPVKPTATTLVAGPLQQVASTFHPPTGTPITAGNYECRFALNGTVVADKPFQVTDTSR